MLSLRTEKEINEIKRIVKNVVLKINYNYFYHNFLEELVNDLTSDVILEYRNEYINKSIEERNKIITKLTKILYKNYLKYYSKTLSFPLNVEDDEENNNYVLEKYIMEKATYNDINNCFDENTENESKKYFDEYNNLIDRLIECLTEKLRTIDKKRRVYYQKYKILSTLLLLWLNCGEDYIDKRKITKSKNKNLFFIEYFTETKENEFITLYNKMYNNIKNIKNASMLIASKDEVIRFIRAYNKKSIMDKYTYLIARELIEQILNM